MFDELDAMELCKARSRANPFETLKSAFFMNRAALKMANIDAATNFLFTSVDRQVRKRCYSVCSRLNETLMTALRFVLNVLCVITVGA